MPNEEDLFHELSFYTLAHSNQAYFIHQHIVDAFAVQHANESTKTIKLVYGLLGLCLYLEHGFTGKEVQNVHVFLSKDKSNWPQLILPKSKVNFSVGEILKAKEGKERDAAIRKWCETIWKNHRQNHAAITEWLVTRKVLSPS